MMQGKKLSTAEKRSIRSSYFKYLVPTIIGMVAHCCYCLADVFFVGLSEGADGLAALNVALPIFTAYSTFSIMLGVGAATTISISIGEKNSGRVNQLFTLSVAGVTLIGACFSVFGTIFIGQVPYLLGATPLIAGSVSAYLWPINLFAFVYMLSSALSVIVRNDGNPKLVMIAGTAGNLTNILLDYVFVLIFKMGIFGAGLATIIGPFVTLSILSLHFILKQNHMWFCKKFFSLSLLWRMIKNGVGSGVLELSAGLIILMFNMALLRVSGENAVAVFAIISNIAYVGKGIFNGMAQAAQPVISYNYGAKRFRYVVQVNRYAMLTAGLFGVACYAVLALFPGPILSLFVGGDTVLLSIGVPAVMLYFLSFPFTGLNTILMYYFQSTEKAVHTIVIAVLRGVVLIAAALAILPWLFGLNGVWLSLAAAEAAVFAVFYPIRLYTDRRLLS